MTFLSKYIVYTRFYRLIILYSIILHTVRAGFDANAKNNVAVYWGQGPNQERLSFYCKKGLMDIAILSFLNKITPDTAGFNFGNACWGPECPLIAEDIKICQSLGIKVMLSLGGDAYYGDFNLESDSGGEAAATYIYQMFNLKSNAPVIKPFGPDVQIDGFDLDVENYKQNGQIALYKKLRELWGDDPLLLSAGPQCPFPDTNVGELVETGILDIIFLQFYSNPSCNMIASNAAFSKSWDTWTNEFEKIESLSNKKPLVFVGLQGQQNDAWHANLSYITSQMIDKKSNKFFSGFSTWDAVAAYNCIDISLGKKMDYLTGLKYLASGVFDNAKVNDEL